MQEEAPLSLELVELATQLHRSDLADLSSRSKGKEKEGHFSAEQEAFRLYAQELEEAEQVVGDWRLALSLDKAGREDEEALDEIEGEEEQARRDHELAVRLDGGRTKQQSTQEKPATNSVSGPSGSSSSSPVASTSTSTSLSTPPPPKIPLHDCLICGDSLPVSQGIKVPCPSHHFYCRACLCDLFLAASKDESLFPPRCDGAPIPFDLVKPFLTESDSALFHRKSEEFSTLNRLYCSKPSCSAFLGPARPDSKEKVGVRCEACGTETCRACKAPWHGVGGLCGASGDDEAAKWLTQDRGFRRCSGCKRMVELVTGCFHMTCLCYHQFCYLCGATWKTCSCPQAEEDRLYLAAEEHVEAQNVAGGAEFVAAAPPREQRVAQAMVEIAQNAECAHENWECERGPHIKDLNCEFCGDQYRWFLLRCSHCGVLACMRCRHNRFAF